MALVAETASPAAADPAVVWDLLTDLRTWSRWWPDCLSAENLDRHALREGSRIELVVRPARTKLDLHPVVDLLIQGRTLSITHRNAWLQGTIAWTIDPHPTGVRIGGRGVFRGLMTLGNPWLHHESAWQTSLARAVRGLKRASELSS